MTTHCDLSQKHCKPCEGGIPALNQTEAEAMLKNIPQWLLLDKARKLQRRFEFKGFNKTMCFINAIAWTANQEMHHPDVSYGYNYCEVTYTTHAINGLSENDFICASKIDALFN